MNEAADLITRRLWLALHGLPVLSIAILTVEGLRLQQCPPIGANGDHGPFAYGRNSIASSAAIWMLAIYVLGAVTLTVLALVTARSSVPKRAVTATNVLLPILFLFWVIGFWLAQEDSAQFCESSGFVWLLVLNGPLILGALVINWPFPKRQRGETAVTTDL